MTTLAVLNKSLQDLIGLPDPEAADQLDKRMRALDVVDRIHQVSFVERGIIAQQFEQRALWKHLEDPETGQPFPSFSAWMSCSDFLGCRRTNFDAKKTMEQLQDVPTAKLIDVPTGNLKVLTQLSTAVRNQPDILEAAKSLPQSQFEQKVEKEHPSQHIEQRAPYTLRPTRSERRDMTEWVDIAIAEGLASNASEAIARACQMAKHDTELDKELSSLPEMICSSHATQGPEMLDPEGRNR